MGEDRKVEWYNALRSGIGFSLSNLIYMAQGHHDIAKVHELRHWLGFKIVVYVAEMCRVCIYLVGVVCRRMDIRMGERGRGAWKSIIVARR